MKNFKIVTIVLIMLLLTTGIVFAADSIDHGDKILLFKDMKIEEDVMIRGDIIAIFSDVEIDGMVDGEVVSVFGDIGINGTVDGDVVSVLGRIDLGDNAIITRDKIQVLSGIGRTSSASVRGDEINIISFEHQLPGIAILLIAIMVIFVIKNIIDFLLSLILLAAIPERMDKITVATTQRTGRRFGIGILAVISFYASSAILGAIIIGAPAVLILVLLKWLLGIGGKTAIKLSIGRKIGKNGDWSQITQLIVGSLIYLIIDVTLVGALILYLGKLIGMGAVIDTRVGTTDYWDMNKKQYTGGSPTYTTVNEDTKREEDQTSISNSTIEDPDDVVDITKKD